MHGNVTNEEWQIFKEAYQFFSDHCLPPANQDECAVDWWMSAAKDVGALDAKWKEEVSAPTKMERVALISR